MKFGMTAMAFSMAACTVTPAHAWQQETHCRTVLDVVTFMKNNPSTTNYNKLPRALRAPATR